MTEWDYWAGTFGLVVFATLEIILFVWVFGMPRAWEELHHGAELRIPQAYRFIMKWVTPAFLLTLLGWWGVTQAVPTFLIKVTPTSLYSAGVPEENVPHLWLSRLVIVLMLLTAAYLVKKAWDRRPDNEGPEGGES
jgi:hypothetical protein